MVKEDLIDGFVFLNVLNYLNEWGMYYDISLTMDGEKMILPRGSDGREVKFEKQEEISSKNIKFHNYYNEKVIFDMDIQNSAFINLINGNNFTLNYSRLSNRVKKIIKSNDKDIANKINIGKTNSRNKTKNTDYTVNTDVAEIARAELEKLLTDFNAYAEKNNNYGLSICRK